MPGKSLDFHINHCSEKHVKICTFSYIFIAGSERPPSNNGTYGVTIQSPENSESFCSITLEILFPFLVAGLGMVGAGLVLDIVQHWKVFVEIHELFILVPALLGLKGNLEMTLASRLSTQVSLHSVEISRFWYH